MSYEKEEKLYPYWKNLGLKGIRKIMVCDITME